MIHAVALGTAWGTACSQSEPSANQNEASGGSGGFAHPSTGGQSSAGASGSGGSGPGGAEPTDDEPDAPLHENAFEVLLDPYDRAPLAALIVVDTKALEFDEVTVAQIRVAGQRGAGPLEATLDLTSETFSNYFDSSDLLDADEIGIPILGLYQNASNQVSFRLGNGKKWVAGEAVIEIANLYDERVRIHRAIFDQMEPGFTYLAGAPNSSSRIYDDRGELRWTGPQILRPSRDGNLLLGLQTVNRLGRVLSRWSLPNTLAFHHDATELDAGRLVACVSNSETSITNPEGEVVASVDDYTVLLDSNSQILEAWDLRPFLDVDRSTLSNRGGDWAHVNTVYFDESNHELYVSSRYQGLLKLSGRHEPGDPVHEGKSLEWILAPHMGWGPAGPNGDGELDPNDYLLTAVDRAGVPYDEDVQNNLTAPPDDRDDFHWPLGQHGIYFLGRDGEKVSFLIFNNQASFLFDGEGSIDNGSTWSEVGDLSNDRSQEPYSLLAAYEVDEAKRTVRQAFGYGEGMPDLYGSFNSGVNRLTNTGNLMMISNGASQHTKDDVGLNPHVIELSADGKEVFHLEVEQTGLSAYRGGRIELYPH